MSCPDCFSGTMHLGSPTGTMKNIHGLPTYVANPPEGVTPIGIIVYIPDAFGWQFVNNRILADHYAKRGNFLVYLPDFMNGSSLELKCLSLMENIQAPSSWFTTLFYKPLYILQAMRMVIPWVITCRASVVRPRIIKFFQDLRTSPPPFSTSSLKIGAAGFCWGGKYTFLLAADPPSTRIARHSSQDTAGMGIQPLIDCAFTAHPSMLSFPGDIEKVELPLSVAVGDVDMQATREQVIMMKEILEVKKKGDHEVVVMPGAKHGFGVRTDTKDEYQMECAEKAEEQAVAWFSRWFA